MDNALFHGDLVDTSRILYTPSNFAKTCLIHLQEIGSLKAQKTHICKRENLASFLFFFVVSGSGTLTYNTSIYALRTGDCVFIDCKKPYSHETSENLWQLKWIHFYGPNVSNIYEKYLERGGQAIIHPKELRKFEEAWLDLYNLATTFDYIRDMRINEGLTSILTLLMAESWHPGNGKNYKKQNLFEIKKYLDIHYREKITLDKLAEKFFINKFYLTRAFKSQYGISINNYLLQIRITRAKQLLRFTDKTSETIGLECGMGELYYFSRTFKKVEGISPSEYRRKW